MAAPTDPAAGSAPPEEAPPASRWRDRPLWGERPRWQRWTAGLATALVLVLIAASVFAVTAVRRPFPVTDGRLEVPLLDSEVSILRDEHGVPHVYADNAQDLFFAQGFVHAQDRFFEMDVRRHLTAGRLSEMFGRDTLETDKVVRTMGWRDVAEVEVSRLGDRAAGYFEAYSAGVNAYITDRSPSELSLEYTLLSATGLDYQVEPWSPVDSMAWLKAVAWDLRGTLQDEVDRAMASTRLSAAQIDELYPPYPYDTHRPVLPEGALGRLVTRAVQRDQAEPAGAAGAAGIVEEPLTEVRRALEAVPALVGHGDGIGSNAWVVDGSRSATGRPLLANDPHLAPSVPGIWYPMALHCTTVEQDCPFEVTGFTFSGFPGVILGHNRAIAWGMTNLAPDVSDLYLEAVDGERYRRGPEWRLFSRRRETIRIAGEPSFSFTARSSVHGPLLSDVSGLYASVGANAPATPRAPDRATGYAVALAWTALTPNRTAEAIFAMNTASSWREFRRAARLFAVPAQNLVYADRRGNIGYQALGTIPVRGPGNTGRYPSPGWDPANDWTGVVPFSELPSQLNPAEGYVVTANQAPAGPGYPHFLGDGWDYGYRSQRILDLLADQEQVDVEDMARMQLDTYNGFAPAMVPHLLRIDPGSRYYEGGQRLLRDWDFTQPADSAAAAYFNAVVRNLLRLTFADDLPGSVEVTGSSRWWAVLTGLLDEPGSPWWDDVTTEGEPERRDDIVRIAMRDARDELVRLQAREPSRWTWGHQHTLRLEDPTLGQSDVGLVAALVNRGPWEVGGGSGAINATGWNAVEGYEVTWAPSMRMVVSLGRLNTSRWVNLSGVSGHAFHRHYVDQTEVWADGETLPWPWGRRAVERAAEDRLTLVPFRTGG